MASDILSLWTGRKEASWRAGVHGRAAVTEGRRGQRRARPLRWDGRVDKRLRQLDANLLCFSTVRLKPRGPRPQTHLFSGRCRAQPSFFGSLARWRPDDFVPFFLASKKSKKQNLPQLDDKRASDKVGSTMLTHDSRGPSKVLQRF